MMAKNQTLWLSGHQSNIFQDITTVFVEISRPGLFQHVALYGQYHTYCINMYGIIHQNAKD